MRTLFAVFMSLVTAMLISYLAGSFIQLNFHYLPEITPADRGFQLLFSAFLVPFTLMGWLTLLEKDNAS